MMFKLHVSNIDHLALHIDFVSHIHASAFSTEHFTLL